VPPRIRLYTQTVNPFAEKVARALRIKGLVFERVVTDDPRDYRILNPETGLLPVLDIERERFHDSAAIVRELERRFPEPPLYASDPKLAMAQEQLERWSDTSFLWYWNAWRRAQDERERRSDEDARRRGLARLRARIEATLGGVVLAARPRALPEEEILAELEHRLADLVRLLGSRPYFHGERPSVADLSVYGMLRVMRAGPMAGAATLLDRHPRMLAFMERMDVETGEDWRDPLASRPADEGSGAGPAPS
jgi:glutathione S-transferase